MKVKGFTTPPTGGKGYEKIAFFLSHFVLVRLCFHLYSQMKKNLSIISICTLWDLLEELIIYVAISDSQIISNQSAKEC